MRSAFSEKEQNNQCSICAGQVFLLQSDQEAAYYRCMRCGSLHRKTLLLKKTTMRSMTHESWDSQEKSSLYEEDYFVTDYEKQYGRSYIEDAPAIRSLARNRLQRLQKMYTVAEWNNRHDFSLCDIGCALGFFLDEARRAGFGQASGVEISRYASHFCETHFQLPVVNQGLMQWESNRKFDVITLFYVLEHFPAQKEILKKIYHSLVPGGKLILALPSTWGPQFLWQKKTWLRLHPKDHYVDYDPLSIRLVLKQFGFSVDSVYAGPAHFERYPISFLWNNPVFHFFPWEETMEKFRIFAEFGDTMEVYARRQD